MATTSNYSKIRFIGYAIPTTPANLTTIQSGAVVGTYLGNTDTPTDIAARVAVLQNAVQTAKAALPANEDPTSVLNVFLGPEFYFHGPAGPYVVDYNQTDPVVQILPALQAAFPASEYPNWTFVFGTAMTTRVGNFQRICNDPQVQARNGMLKKMTQAWQQAELAFGPAANNLEAMTKTFIAYGHANPVVQIRNRAMIVSNIPIETFRSKSSSNTMTTEKYYQSHEDFVLYEVNGNTNVVTEQMVAYRPIDLSGGDLKQVPYDEYAIFQLPPNLDLGVEICLDHADGRLRKNIDYEPFPQPTDGLHVHLVPSCGMQIELTSVAADANGFVFNCDGQYPVTKTVGSAQQADLYGVNCIYVNYVDSANSAYGAHTQLARVQTPAVGGDPSASTSKNATFQTLDPTVVAILPVSAVANLDQYFAGGPGQIHIYGLSTPYELYPTSTQS